MYPQSISRNVRRLSKDEVINIAPSVLTVDPHGSLSKRYSPISTMDIIDILEADKWFPVRVKEVNARTDHTEGFQKHMVTFQNLDLRFGEENVEANLTNSHDGKSRYVFLLGLFRLICSNGLVAGDIFEKLALRHVGLEQDMVVEASKKMLDFAPVVVNSMNEMKQIELSPEERNIYGESAKMLLFPKVENKGEIPIPTHQILQPRRYSDQAKSDLWTTFNTVQENVIKGGMRSWNQKKMRRQTTRRVKAIDKNLSLNRALWNLTEEMKKLKTA